MLGLYVHIPFCSHICNYCNFNRGLLDPDLKARYVSAIVAEIRRAGDGSAADTIFFGGGTPSLLDPEEVARIIGACRDAFAVTVDAEVTLETNPETVTVARMRGFADAGVNRVSLGVQSLHDRELARLGRQHSASRASEAHAQVRESGIRDTSLDLMLWLPEQRLDDWQGTIEGLIALEPDHASMYLLELYPNAPLREEMARARWSLAPDDDAADMYLWALERLDAGGYEQYEISNVARPNHRSRHNLKYWQDGAWLGFGCGAHSTRGAARWRNVASTEDYVRSIEAGQPVAVDRRERTVEEQLGDALFTGLRLTDGIDLAATGARYGVDAWSRYEPALRRQAEAGRIVLESARARLTRPGMLVANDVMAIFV